MKKINVVKNDETFTFTEPFANDLLEYQIDSGEIREQLVDLQDKAKPFMELDPTKLSEDDKTEMNKVLVKINLTVAKMNKINYSFAVKHLVDVKSKNTTLKDVQSLKVSMDSLQDVFDAFNESLTMEADEGKK